MDLKELKGKKIANAKSEKISKDDLENYTNLFEHWGFDDEGRFISNFEFDNFKKAIEFVNTIAELAEKEEHHPDIMIYSYKNVLVLLYTHDVDGITEKDFVMAAKVEGLILDKDIK